MSRELYNSLDRKAKVMDRSKLDIDMGNLSKEALLFAMCQEYDLHKRVRPLGHKDTTFGGCAGPSHEGIVFPP